MNWTLEPGIHTISFGHYSPTIDIYINSQAVSTRAHEVIPVFFNAAISTRDGHRGPFFSGIRISNEYNLPLISVSDPAVDNDISLKLGWYTGGKDELFVENLLKVLEVLKSRLEAEPLFCGGSGGGFAALNVAAQYPHDSTVFVWNPQTNIYNYSERFVKQYLKSQFKIHDQLLDSEDWKKQCSLITDRHVSTSVVVPHKALVPRRLAYIQNKSDWHFRKHLTPFWSMVSPSELEDGRNTVNDDYVAFVGEFAAGHAPPSKELIGGAIKQLLVREFKVSCLELT
ncbi:hypothetical protein ACTXMY_00025 [Glutamicibacter ardleyensis]